MDITQLATLLFIFFWILLTSTILLFGKRIPRLADFRQSMLRQWKPALAISLLYLLGIALGGRVSLDPYALAIFCEAMIGLALARGIPAFDPLPVTAAILSRTRIARALALALLWAVVAATVAFVAGGIVMSFAQQFFHETNQNSQALNGFAPGPWQAFGLFLSGAGIGEETPFRLVVVGLLWRFVRRRGWAVFLAALLFAAYHLTPLNSMYRTFLLFPVSQFLSSVIYGLVWGWLFVKRGYETTVLAHTLSDWVPMMVFLR
jgi:membrane protease YdiL (CAAX protease family)